MGLDECFFYSSSALLQQNVPNVQPQQECVMHDQFVGHGPLPNLFGVLLHDLGKW